MSPPGELELVFPERERVELRPVERPAEPLAGNEVEGRTLVTLLSVGTELAMRAGLFEYPFPLEPGYAAAFSVERVGAEVSTVAPGDLAFTMGPHRSFQRAPEEEVIRVPAAVAPETAVFCRMASVGWTALTKTTARPPEQAWVLGLGLVGHLTAQVLAASGYSVRAYDPRADRRAFLSGVGGLVVESDLEEALAAEERKAALVVECSGSTASVVNACELVRAGGEVVLVGGPWKRESDVDAATLHRLVYRKHLLLRGGLEWQVRTLRDADGAPSMLGNMEGALDWLARGRIAVPPGAYSLSPPAVEIYDHWSSGKADGLTTLFDWR